MGKAKVVTAEPQSSVLIELPVAEVPKVTWTLHVDTRLTPKQTNSLRRIAAGLDAAQARLESGTRVVKPNDALKYLLEEAAGGSE